MQIWSANTTGKVHFLHLDPGEDILNGLNELGLTAFEPRGAFYIFPCVTSTGLSSEAFAQELLQEQHVAVVPGTAFGPSGEGYVRCSYAASLKNINEALKRIGLFLENRK